MLLGERKCAIGSHHDKRGGVPVGIERALRDHRGAQQVGFGGEARARVKDMVVQFPVLLEGALVDA